MFRGFDCFMLEGENVANLLTGGRDCFVTSEGEDKVTDFNSSEDKSIVYENPYDIARERAGAALLIARRQRELEMMSWKSLLAKGNVSKIESSESPCQKSPELMQR